MATASATYFHNHSDEFLWKLVSATACDTKDVASELPIASPAILDEVRSGFSALFSAWHLRGRFGRLAERQSKVISRLKDSQPETWPKSDCNDMAHLLDELIHDETSVITNASDSPKPILFLWEKSLARLRSQTDELKSICFHMDALSVAETQMPGDEGYREFLSLLNAPDEHDFSTDNDSRKVHAY
jgi:hypothetical protein